MSTRRILTDAGIAALRLQYPNYPARHFERIKVIDPLDDTEFGPGDLIMPAPVHLAGLISADLTPAELDAVSVHLNEVVAVGWYWHAQVNYRLAPSEVTKAEVRRTGHAAAALRGGVYPPDAPPLRRHPEASA